MSFLFRMPWNSRIYSQTRIHIPAPWRAIGGTPSGLLAAATSWQQAPWCCCTSSCGWYPAGVWPTQLRLRSSDGGQGLSCPQGHSTEPTATRTSSRCDASSCVHDRQLGLQVARGVQLASESEDSPTPSQQLLPMAGFSRSWQTPTPCCTVGMHCGS